MAIKRLFTLLSLCALPFAANAFVLPAQAGIEQLLIDKVPVPQKRPKLDELFRQKSNEVTSKNVIIYDPVFVGDAKQYPAIKGSLKNGLDALRKKDISRALSIRAGMKAGSIERKSLAWAIAMSGYKGVPSSHIASITRDLSNWPGQNILHKNAEKALVRENPSTKTVINAFDGKKPYSVEGAILKAKAHLKMGHTEFANRIISPFWRNKVLTKKQENAILASLKPALTRADHRYRMHKLFYEDRTKAAMRVAPLAEQVSLAKARTAAIRSSSNSFDLIKAVAPSSQKDIAYLFTRIENNRRNERYSKAAELMLNAPSDQVLLIDPDEWWVERRIISRHMIELGKYITAYRLAATHSAKSPSDKAEAEFHAGWYALRFLKDPETAKRHFNNIIEATTRPISQARGYYWLGRASNKKDAVKHYKQAAKYSGTFYGQLAAEKLGIKKLRITKPKPTDKDRKSYQSRELVRAIKAFERADYDSYASLIYLELGKRLVSHGELALLSADAERKKKNAIALHIGKTAYNNGEKVETLSWPIGAIPDAAKVSKQNRALAYAIARQESAFNKAAVSPANARGLMQLLPSTAKLVARKTGLRYSYKRLTSDAAYNTRLGTSYLNEQLDNFENSYVLTFAGYNAGPSKASEWIERFGDPRNMKRDQVIDWIEMIPYTETRHYVQRVMENYQVYKARLYGSNLELTKDITKGRR